VIVWIRSGRSNYSLESSIVLNAGAHVIAGTEDILPGPNHMPITTLPFQICSFWEFLEKKICENLINLTKKKKLKVEQLNKQINHETDRSTIKNVAPKVKNEQKAPTKHTKTVLSIEWQFFITITISLILQL